MPSFARYSYVFMLFLAGCAGSGAGPIGIGAVVGDRNLAEAEPLFAKDETRCLDSADRLMDMIFSEAPIQVGTFSRTGSSTRCGEILASFQRALTPRTANTAPDAPRSPLARYDAASRNEIIDILIATSNRKCGRYSSLLKNADGAMNAGLSLSSIITGGLGAIVGGEATAKALAGASSILSGSRAALNEAYLTNQTIHVLAAAYEKSRDSQRREITNRQACNVTQYTLARGVEDAFNYHRSCSIVVGLAETARAVERSDNPGLDAMRLQMAGIKALRQQAAELVSEGAPTPIAAPVSPVDLAFVEARNAQLVAAQKLVADAEAALLDKRTLLQGQPAALVGEPPATTTARDAAAKAVVAAAETVQTEKGKRDDIGLELQKSLRALSGAKFVSESVQAIPETRKCPFDTPS